MTVTVGQKEAEAVGSGAGTAFKMRKECHGCSCPEGVIRERGFQDCVFCIQCGKFQYNAPRVETGKSVRSVTTVHNGISPRKRADVLMRAGGACELCHAVKHLDVAHLLSVKTGLEHGMTEAILNSEENLAAMCAECNAGIGSRPVPLRIAISIVLERTKLGGPR